jgi:molybdenum cofactor synthesis domain-containing protein
MVEGMTHDLSGVTVAIVTVSDRVSAGESRDRSGPVLAEAFYDLGAHVMGAVVPDGTDSVSDVLRAAIAEGASVVVTTGGTGIGPRDLTPEATRPLIERELPGISERLRATDAYAVPTTALSRGLAGITAEGVIVVNVAGSETAAKAAAVVLSAVLPHAVAQLAGADH